MYFSFRRHCHFSEHLKYAQKYGFWLVDIVGSSRDTAFSPGFFALRCVAFRYVTLRYVWIGFFVFFLMIQNMCITIFHVKYLFQFVIL